MGNTRATGAISMATGEALFLAEQQRPNRLKTKIETGKIIDPRAARAKILEQNQAQINMGPVGIGPLPTFPKVQTKPPKNSSPVVTTTNKGQAPTDVKFNLPPHLWSLPVKQEVLNSNNFNPYQKTIDHKTRRAIMWCYGYTNLASGAYQFSPVADTVGANLFLEEHTNMTPDDTKWGFQFLWNPDRIGNALSRNVNFTPNPADKTAKFYGLFTAMEAVSFTITINRINDFACIKGMVNIPSASSYAASQQIPKQAPVGSLEPFYTNGYPGVKQDINSQISDLMRMGTMADIEYIYKMINGSGMGGKQWSNALGRVTADIGMLSPTVVGVQFGPNKDSLSYVGYIDRLVVSHQMFTEDMIPILSEVNVDFVAFARTELTEKPK